MPTISCMHRSEADEATRKVYEDIIKTYGCIAPGSLDTSLSHAAGLSDIAVCHA